MTDDTTTSAGGFLAIWSDVAREIETDYLHWLTREHTQERLGVPGFLSVRVFRALGTEARRYFILYTLRDAAVLGSEAYLARLNAPTPWSQRIMPQLKNFARGGGRKVAQFGSGRGGTIAALRFDAALAPRPAGSRRRARDGRPRHRRAPLRDRPGAHRDPHQ